MNNGLILRSRGPVVRQQIIMSLQFPGSREGYEDFRMNPESRKEVRGSMEFQIGHEGGRLLGAEMIAATKRLVPWPAATIPEELIEFLLEWRSQNGGRTITPPPASRKKAST